MFKNLILDVQLHRSDSGEFVQEKYRQFWSDNPQSNHLCIDAQVMKTFLFYFIKRNNLSKIKFNWQRAGPVDRNQRTE